MVPIVISYVFDHRNGNPLLKLLQGDLGTPEHQSVNNNSMCCFKKEYS
jgi:hypothetical protein